MRERGREQERERKRGEKESKREIERIRKTVMEPEQERPARTSAIRTRSDSFRCKYFNCRAKSRKGIGGNLHAR